MNNNDKPFQQKAQIGQKIFFLENKIGEDGYALRDKYVIKDGIVVQVNINIDCNLRSNKKFDGKNWNGPADTIVLNLNSSSTTELYKVLNATRPLDKLQVYTNINEIREVARRMIKKYPEITVEESIENYTVEFR